MVVIGFFQEKTDEWCGHCHISPNERPKDLNRHNFIPPMSSFIASYFQDHLCLIDKSVYEIATAGDSTDSALNCFIHESNTLDPFIPAPDHYGVILFR